MEKIIESIVQTEDYQDIKNVFWKSFYNKKINKKNTNVKIILFNLPCAGFGDIVFTMKIANYMRDWYGANVTIASTDIESFKKLGETKNLIKLGTKTKYNHCRRFRYLNCNIDFSKYDLYFITPVQSNHDANMKDFNYLVPKATMFNTFFFSEYNHETYDNDFDFPTGIGEGKYGILLTKPKIGSNIHKQFKNPYVFAYISDIDYSELCFQSFIEMICAKYYKKHNILEIVCPAFLEDNLDMFVDKIKKYYPIIEFRYKDGEYSVLDNSKNKRSNTLIFRCDIFPVSYDNITTLMKHSIKDILVTGDQSITDVLSCCKDKNIWYQSAGWKIYFTEELAKNMPNKYFKSVNTSCGTIKAVKYRSNYNKFLENWNFTRLAKPKLDGIIQYILFKKKNKEFVEEIEDIILKSRSVNSIIKKIERQFDF